MNNLTYKVVNIEEDYPMIASWYEARELPVPPKDWFAPGIGIMCPNIAATFLFICENRAYIEDTISNPNSDKEERDQALHTIGDMLEEEAKNKGIKYLIAAASNPSVIERAFKHDYRIVRGQFYQIMKMLKEII